MFRSLFPLFLLVYCSFVTTKDETLKSAHVDGQVKRQQKYSNRIKMNFVETIETPEGIAGGETVNLARLLTEGENCLPVKEKKSLNYTSLYLLAGHGRVVLYITKTVSKCFPLT